MARVKIDYGIDLGTTNSSISRMDNGEHRIIKSDDGQADTTPSCIYFNKKQILFVGQKALNSVDSEAKKNFIHYTKTGGKIDLTNSFIEFKRRMGSDENYECSNMQRSFTPEELSAEVLKKLKSYVRDEDEPLAVVITVPAMFQQHQIAATNQAAELAGFQYCELLQEPIAASLAYGLTNHNATGYWLVFDFGGGTFDAALMRVEEGIIKVQDTSGDNRLGGKNIDDAIVDDILIPHLEQKYNLEIKLGNEIGRQLLREALKRAAEEIKINFADNKSEYKFYLEEDLGEDDEGNELEMDITIPLKQFEEVVKPIFQRAVSICQELLDRNKMTGSDLNTVLLVGGPTFLESLRNILKTHLTEKIDFSIDPMTAVTKGAALFASTKDIPMDLQMRDRAKIQLKLKYPETTVETDEKLGIKVERTQTEGDIPEKLFVEVCRNDKGWSSGKIQIVDDAEIVAIRLIEAKPNGFTINLFDEQGSIYPCEPSTFSVIQGLAIPKSTLSLNICIEALSTEYSRQCNIPIPGLEKNKSLPVKGKQTFRTQRDLRPGNKDDFFEVTIFETEEPYSRSFPHEWVASVRITGEDLPQFLPKNSEVEVTLNIDPSRRIRGSFYFPYLDEAIDKECPARKQKGIPAEMLEGNIEKALHSLTLLSGEVEALDVEDVERIEAELFEVRDLLNKGRNDGDRKDEVAKRLGELVKKIDLIREQGQWPAAKQELDAAFDMVTQTQQRLGDDQTSLAISKLRSQANAIIKDQNTKAARQLAETLRSLDYHMVREDTGFWASFIVNFDHHFDTYDWQDSNAARKLIGEGKRILVTNPSRAKLEDVVRSLFQLMPDKTQPIGDIDLSVLRH